MIELSLAQIAGITGGKVTDAVGSAPVTGPAFLDSRSPEPGGLFVALAGERADGHDFAAAAIGGGAAAVLAGRPTGLPSVVVDDVRGALQQLAREVLSRLRAAGDLRVLAVTGSQGKTSVKDMLAAVLSDDAQTVATAGSFNNELGLPLTVLRAGTGTRHLVLEMGARGVGHLTGLCEIARPDISLVLNVGKAHLGEFGSQERIALAKGELVEALPAQGVAVLNADDPLVLAMSQRTRAWVTTFGCDDAADLRLDDVRLDELGRPTFALTAGGLSEPVSLALLGEHQAMNAAAAAAAALAAGLSLDRIAPSLSAVERLSPWRMELGTREDGLVVLNDAYNANPDSMRAALRTLASIGAGSHRATIAVLGEMLELGAASAEEHRAVGTLALELGVDRVVVVGAGTTGPDEIAAGVGSRAVRCGSVSEAEDWVSHNVAGTEVVLVKASRSVGLEQVAEALMRVAAPETTLGG